MGVHRTIGAESDAQRKLAWLIPTGLITLGTIPILANAVRRVALSAGTVGAPVGDGSGSLTLPVVLHIVGATVFVVLGALQFSSRLRRRRSAWHRIAGRATIAAGLLAAASGLWLALFVGLPAGSGPLLLVFRLLAGTAMVLCIVLGLSAVRQRNFRRHSEWMIRAYAIGLGAGTQVFALGFGEAFFGRSELSVALLNGAGWVINLAVAEAVIRGRAARDGRSGRPRAPRRAAALT